jgi:2-dehydropantoate 2-reductase
MHHAILGAGGIGGLIGAVLAHAGEQVTLIVRPESAARQPRQLSLESKLGNFTVPVAVEPVLTGPVDVLWITVKATQLESALESIPSDASVRGVVPLLNGIDHVSLLRKCFGHDRVIPATISVESERTAPGLIVQRSPFVRLNVAESGKPLLASTLDLFDRFGFERKFIENESTLLWSKLAFLAPFALSTTAAGAPIGDVRKDPRRRKLLDSCIREACAVANANNAGIKPDALIATASQMPPEMRSSMQKDVKAENPPELDAIAGPILRGGPEHGIPALATQELVIEIRQKLKARAAG